jgi:hypothetical protein
VTPDLSIVKGGVSLSSGLKQALSSRQMMKESGSHSWVRIKLQQNSKK